MDKYFLIIVIALGVLVLLNYWEIKKVNKLVNSLILSSNDVRQYIESTNNEKILGNSNNMDTIQKEIDDYKKEINELDNEIGDDSTVNIEDTDNYNDGSEIIELVRDVDANINNIEYDQGDTLSGGKNINDSINDDNHDICEDIGEDIGEEHTINDTNNDSTNIILLDTPKALEFYYDNYNVPDLKTLCKDNGLTVGGNKKNLIERLLESNILNPRIDDVNLNKNPHVISEQ